MKTKIPIWIIVISGCFALMEFFAGVSFFALPESMFETIDFSDEGSQFLIKSWATRQFALGVLFAFALYQRSKSLLMGAYLFLTVMFLGDVAVGMAQKDNTVIFSGLFMSIVAGFIFVVVARSHKKDEEEVKKNKR